VIEFKHASEFLSRFRPGGPWVLTAIEPDRSGITTETLKDERTVEAWLSANETRNVYFSVNSTVRELKEKASRAEIKEVAWLHVDVDPRPDGDLAAEQERSKRLLLDPVGGIPKPTCVVFSGGGHQAFWKLKVPIPVNGDVSAADDAALYNLQLELALGGDRCHNVDRIMRLPGTVNWPDEKKRRRGRLQALARVVHWELDAGGNPISYDLSRFTKSRSVQKADDGFAGGKIKISGNVRRLKDVHELDAHAGEGRTIPDWVKVTIVQGNRSDDDKPYASRSEALFAVCCWLAKAGIPDEVVYSVITDPDFKISASVLDKGSGVERYAARQIERAKEEVESPHLRSLNDRYAVVRNWGGRCRVLEEVYCHAMKRPRLTKISFADFANAWCNTRVDVGKKPDGSPARAPLGKWWLQHEARRQYDGISFSPGREVPGSYNLWRGFAVDPKPGDCSMFLDHVLQNVCSGDRGHYDYLIGWMARAVQVPDSPGYSAVVLKGKPGTGKSFFAKAFGSLWGRHFMQVTDSKHLVGSFNAHLRDCVVLFGDEAFWAGDKKHEGILKTLITEETLTIEQKGVDAESAPNYVHLIMASNEDWVVPAGVGDRRFFVLEVAEGRMRDDAWFAAAQAQLDAGGREALLHLLQSADLRGFNVRDVPRTAALGEQKDFSMRLEYEWWQNKLDDGQLLPTHEGWERMVLKTALYDDVAQYASRLGSRNLVTRTRLTQFLRKVCPAGWPFQQRLKSPIEVSVPGGGRQVIPYPRYYVFPSMEECRAAWEAGVSGEREWEDAEEVDAPGDDGKI
jgi:Mesyanzhinovviridae DNA primase